MTKEEKNEKQRLWRLNNPDKVKKQAERQKEYRKTYYQDNRDTRIKYHKNYRQANKDKINEYRKANKDKYKGKYSDTQKAYYEANKDKYKGKYSDTQKAYYEANKDKYKGKYSDTRKAYYEANKDKHKAYYEANKDKKKAYYQANKDKINKRVQERKQNNSLYKLKCNLRSLIRESIKGKGYKKNTKTEQILGCSFEQFKQHLESQFESWMNWDNYGNPKDGIFEPNKTWDIDHVKPISTGLTENEVIELNQYTNLTPLCSYVNRWIKRDKQM